MGRHLCLLERQVEWRGTKKKGRDWRRRKDLALKSAALYFGEEIIPWLGVKKKVRRIAQTETVRLEMRHLYEDFLYEMEDGSYYHFEFESDSLSENDLKRFREYEATTARLYQAPVVTYVICSAEAKTVRDSITEGINTYRVRLISLKDGDADRIIERLQEEPGQGIAREDLIPLLFTPLMGGKSTKKERIQKSIQMLRKTENIFAKAEISKMEAILYVFAAKLLDKTDLESIKEVFSMTLLGQMIWDDALEKGREQESERYSRLILLLNEKKQTDLIVKAASDPEYREMLYRKYHI